MKLRRTPELKCRSFMKSIALAYARPGQSERTHGNNRSCGRGFFFGPPYSELGNAGVPAWGGLGDLAGTPDWPCPAGEREQGF